MYCENQYSYKPYIDVLQLIRQGNKMLVSDNRI